jgi:hypothetical protein
VLDHLFCSKNLKDGLADLALSWLR